MKCKNNIIKTVLPKGHMLWAKATKAVKLEKSCKQHRSLTATVSALFWNFFHSFAINGTNAECKWHATHAALRTRERTATRHRGCSLTMRYEVFVYAAKAAQCDSQTLTLHITSSKRSNCSCTSQTLPLTFLSAKK